MVGDDSLKDPPVPIPNTEVKLQDADGTAGATRWESRSSPTNPSAASVEHSRSRGGSFFAYNNHTKITRPHQHDNATSEDAPQSASPCRGAGGSGLEGEVLERRWVRESFAVLDVFSM